MCMYHRTVLFHRRPPARTKKRVIKMEDDLQRAAVRIQALQRGHSVRSLEWQELASENREAARELKDMRRANKELAKADQLARSLQHEKDRLRERLAARSEPAEDAHPQPPEDIDPATPHEGQDGESFPAVREGPSADHSLAGEASAADGPANAIDLAASAVERPAPSPDAFHAALHSARREQAARQLLRQKRLAQLRAASTAIIFSNALTVAKIPTTFGFIGLSPAAVAMADQLCRLRHAPVGIVRVSETESATPLKSLRSAHGRRVQPLPSRQAVVDSSELIIIDLPAAILPDALAQLSFGQAHTVLSLSPHVPLAELHRLLAPTVLPLHISRALALPQVPWSAEALEHSSRAGWCYVAQPAEDGGGGGADQGGGRDAVGGDDGDGVVGAAAGATAAATNEELGGQSAYAKQGDEPRTAQAAAPLPIPEHARAARTWGLDAATRRAADAAVPPRGGGESHVDGGEGGEDGDGGEDGEGGEGGEGGDAPSPRRQRAATSDRPPPQRLVYCVATVHRYLAAAVPSLVASLFSLLGALSLDLFDGYGWPTPPHAPYGAPTDAPTTQSPTGAVPSVSGRSVHATGCADELSRAVHVAAGREADGLVIGGVDTAEARALGPHSMAAADARRLSLALPHGKLCARLLFGHAEDGGDCIRSEEIAIARTLLLPVYRRGLPPLLGTANPADPAIPSMDQRRQACLSFADDFVLPHLMRLGVPDCQAPPSTRLLQLDAAELAGSRQREAAAARERCAAHLAWMDAAARTPATLRTSADVAAASEARKVLEATIGHLGAAERACEWSDAADAARSVASLAERAAAAYAFPCVGSEVRVESRRSPYLAAEIWEGVVVRHARNRAVISVRSRGGAVRLVSPLGSDRIVQVASPAA